MTCIKWTHSDYHNQCAPDQLEPNLIKYCRISWCGEPTLVSPLPAMPLSFRYFHYFIFLKNIHIFDSGEGKWFNFVLAFVFYPERG